jgi:TetR/AcrR family transcriptional regulator
VNDVSATDRRSARAARVEPILVAAEAVFAEKGFEGATTAAIAARAGVPKANVHYYFPTKATLYRQVIEGILTAWLDAAVFDETASAAAALSAYIEAKMDLARERPLGSRIFAKEVMRGAPVIQDYLDTTLKSWVESRSRIVRRWIEQGQIRDVDPRTLFYMIWATTQHYADFSHQVASLNGGAPLSVEAFAQTKAEIVSIILKGVEER